MAVRHAYRTFEGIREEEIDEFINYRKMDRYFITLNRNTLNIIAAIATTSAQYGYSPKIVIYSKVLPSMPSGPSWADRMFARNSNVPT